MKRNRLAVISSLLTTITLITSITIIACVNQVQLIWLLVLLSICLGFNFLFMILEIAYRFILYKRDQEINLIDRVSMIVQSVPLKELKNTTTITTKNKNDLISSLNSTITIIIKTED